MKALNFFVSRPILAASISLLIFVSGIVCVYQLPVSEYPDFSPPTIVVSARFPGANPKVIAETVAKPIEHQLVGVEDMLYMNSKSTTDGLMTVSVTFQIGTDPEVAQQRVENRVSQVLPRLPEVTRRMGVTTERITPEVILLVHLISA